MQRFKREYKNATGYKLAKLASAVDVETFRYDTQHYSEGPNWHSALAKKLNHVATLRDHFQKNRITARICGFIPSPAYKREHQFQLVQCKNIRLRFLTKLPA